MTKVNASIKDVAKELAENIGWDSMEFYLTKDGETGVRQSGSFGQNESEVVYKVSLDKWYWRDGLENLGLDIDEELNEEDLETLIDYIECTDLSFATDRNNGEELEFEVVE
jgi:hypothetical protein|nr:MAG TPA: hypothetical protein [Caudoviricetes sp.]